MVSALLDPPGSRCILLQSSLSGISVDSAEYD